jgi:hypothetical protein
MNAKTAQKMIEHNAKNVISAYMHYLRVCAFVADGMSHGPVEERDFIESERAVFEEVHARFVRTTNELQDRYPEMKETEIVRQAYKCTRVLYRPSPYSK